MTILGRLSNTIADRQPIAMRHLLLATTALTLFTPLLLVSDDARAQEIVIEGGSTEIVDGSGGGSGTQPNPWSMPEHLFIGGAGSGELRIINGGQVNTGEGGFLGLGADAGSVTVTGSGSSWNVMGGIDVSNGDLTISDGGVVNASLSWGNGSSIGLLGSGSVLVTGENSHWQVGNLSDVGPSSISVGESGNGVLTVADGGRVTAKTVYVGYWGGNGQIAIGAAEGEAAGTAGVLDVGTVTFGSSRGKMVFNHTTSGYEFSADIAGNGAISHLSGDTTLSGDNSGFSGTVTVDGGSLTVQNALGSAVIVNSAGELVVDGATITDAVSGATNGVINVRDGNARIVNGATIVNDTDSYGNALVANGSANVIVSDSHLISHGSGTNGGASSSGVHARGESMVSIEGGSITTTGDRGYAVRTTEQGTIVATGVDIVTEGEFAYGVQVFGANDEGEETSISLMGGSVTTNSQGYAPAIQVSGAQAVLSVGGGSVIETHGTESYGITVDRGGSAFLDDVAIRTDGDLAAGLRAYRWDGDTQSTVLAERVSITTTGDYASGVLVEASGTGGTEIGGATIDLVDSHILTHGLWSHGLDIVGASAGDPNRIRVAGSIVTATGANALAAQVAKGGLLDIDGSTLTSRVGAGIRLLDDATVTLVDTHVSSAQETFVADLVTAGRSQQIVVGAGSVAVENNGTLLRVDRTAEGGDGVVEFILASGSTTSGDIVDESENKTTGGTDVTVEEGASWTGVLRGIRDFIGGSGSELSFEGEAEVQGNLSGNGTSYTFSDQGGRIRGNVELQQNSRTTGGSIVAPIVVDGNVDIDPTSILGGNWSIAGSLTSAGMVSPGNSIGHVRADELVLLPSAVYEVEIDALGRADLIEVAGKAELAGSVTVAPLGGAIIGSPYTILTAGTIDGSFDAEVEFVGSSAFLEAALSYDPGAVLLTVARNDVSFASVAGSTNQRATAEAIDRLPVSSSLVSAIAIGSEEAAAGAFDQLSGEVHGSVTTGLIEQAYTIHSLAADRLRAASSVATVPEASIVMAYAPSGSILDPVPSGAGPAVWATPFGARLSSEGDGNAAALDRASGGMVLGADAAIGDGWHAGAMVGYAHSSIDVPARASSGTSDSYHLGLYAGTQMGNLAFRTSLASTWSDVVTSRTVNISGVADNLSAAYGAHSIHVFGELGYGIDTEGARLEPFANLTHIHVRTAGYTEQGGAAALTSTGRTSDTTFTTLGVRGEMDMGGQEGARLHGTIGWRHALGDTAPAATHGFAGSGVFTVAGSPIDSDTLTLEFGLDMDIGSQASAGISYRGQIGGNTQEHGLVGTFGASF